MGSNVRRMKVIRKYTDVACDLMIIVLLIMITGLIVLIGCTSAAVKYAKAANPQCEVVPIEQRGDWARVLVKCPGEEPRERTYGK